MTETRAPRLANFPVFVYVAIRMYDLLLRLYLTDIVRAARAGGLNHEDFYPPGASEELSVLSSFVGALSSYYGARAPMTDMGMHEELLPLLKSALAVYREELTDYVETEPAATTTLIEAMKNVDATSQSLSLGDHHAQTFEIVERKRRELWDTRTPKQLFWEARDSPLKSLLDQER